MSDVHSPRSPPWWHDAGLRKLNFLLVSCFLSAIANGYVSAIMSSLITNPRWFLDIPGLESPALLGLVVAGQPLGCILAFIPAPWLSDRHGRRVGILFGSIGMTCGFLGQVFSKTFTQFFLMRLLAGFASFFNTLSSSALLLELAHPRQRAIIGALFNTFFFVGSITAAWTSYGSLKISSSWSWRLPVGTQLVWTVLQILLVVFCPESPRWLISNGKEEKGFEIMTKYHANGRVNDEVIQPEVLRVSTTIEMDNQRRSVGWLALFSTPGNRKRLLLSVVIGVATQWVGNGIITFYLAPVLRTIGITSAVKQQGINGGLQIYVWILACGGALLTERLGRRRLLLTSTGIMLVFMSMVTICSAIYSTFSSIAASYAVIVFLFLFFGGYVIGLTPIPILYVSEIWPSRLRAKGTSVFWLTQAAATCFNQYVNPIALQNISWKYYLVYVGVLIGVTVFVFLQVIETKNLSLEDISEIFDRHDAEVPMRRMSESPEDAA